MSDSAFVPPPDEQFHLLCDLTHNALPDAPVCQGKKPGCASGLDHDGLCR